MPAVLCELAEKEGVTFDENGRVLMKETKNKQEEEAKSNSIQSVVSRKSFKRVVV